MPDPHRPDLHRPDLNQPDLNQPDLRQTVPSGPARAAAVAAPPAGQSAAGDSGTVEACFARGTALAGSGRLLEAAQQFQRANLLRPDHPATLTNLGLLLSQLDQHDTALACTRRAVELRPDDAQAALALATVLYRQGSILAAIPSHRRAVALAPGNPIAWTALGDCLLAVGQLDEAIASFRRALRLDPDQLAARRSLAACARPGTQAADIDRLSALLDRADLPVDDRITAGFTLGQMLDTAGRYDEAFARFADANALVLATEAQAGHRFDATAFDAAIDRLIAQVTPDCVARAAAWGNPSELPVFIVGMPRSGSTLVEQIAASHSQVFGAGENQALGRAIEAMARESLPHAPIDWDAAAARGLADRHVARLAELAGGVGSGIIRVIPHAPIDWDAAAARGLADRHVARLAELAGGVGSGIIRVLDKTLDNVFHLGVIAGMFPHARVIICRRDLRDVCLSCYFHRFADPNLYTYDLVACARRARAIERLIAHWRAVLKLRMHEVVYESLVAQPAEEIWRLIDFLGLEHEAACLEAYRTERVVTTASAWQVRQPINTRSVGRWRLYRCHLSALLEVLGDDT